MSELTTEEILTALEEMLAKEQIVTDQAALYDGASDRYNKYAKAKGVLPVPLPTAIVYPNHKKEVQKILMFANEHQINVIPRSGKTATEGGLENWTAQTLVVDGSRMNQIIQIDDYNMQATAGSGVKLQDLENEVRKLGLTTGHSPQSKPMAQLGGLVATRSIGQFSTLYGGIEDMVVGLECVFPNGHVSRIKNVPRRAGGPDIRHVAIGNEGTLCFITEVTVKLFKYFPENHQFHGYLIKDVETGVKILREIMVNGYRPSVARVYDEGDAAQHFDHFHKGHCVLILMVEGARSLADATSAGINEAVDKFKDGIIQRVEDALIENWFNHLNWCEKDIEDEIQNMLDHNSHAGFTTEIAADWETVVPIYHNVINRIKNEFDRAQDLILLGGHSSHSYQTGTNMYFVYNYQIHCKPEEELKFYHHPIQRIIVEETLKLGGSMCHHHGIGKYRNEWTKDEHETAYYMLETLKKAFDPNEIMNYGCIFYKEEGAKYQK